MNKHHQEILEQIKKHQDKTSQSKWGASYLGSVDFHYGISNPVKRQIIKNWLQNHKDLSLEEFIDLQKVRSHLKKSVAIFSDNDPWVPLDNQDDFKEKLGSEIIIEHGMGHFNEGAGIKILPIVLQALIGISS